MTVTNLADARPDYLRLKAIEDQIKVLEAERAKLIDELLPIGNAFFEFQGLHYTAKVVAPTRTSVANLWELKKKDPKTFEAITKTVLDSKKLKALIDTNKLSSTVELEETLIRAHIQVRQVNTEGVELKDEVTEVETA